MSRSEHASTERMPHLEPLNAPDTETGSVRDLLAASAPQPLGGTLRESATHDGDRGRFSQLLGGVATPLKLGLVLENKGNVARDHLASERTYLAYVRTSLACASAGVALVQLFTLGSVKAGTTPTPQSSINQFAKFAKPVGATLVLFALVILVFGFVRYFSTQSALVRGYFPVARHSITTIAFVLASLVGIVFGLVLAAAPG